jgi:hypothetical protein
LPVFKRDLHATFHQPHRAKLPATMASPMLLQSRISATPVGPCHLLRNTRATMSRTPERVGQKPTWTSRRLTRHRRGNDGGGGSRRMMSVLAASSRRSSGKQSEAATRAREDAKPQEEREQANDERVLQELEQEVGLRHPWEEGEGRRQDASQSAASGAESAAGVLRGADSSRTQTGAVELAGFNH